MSSKLLTMNRSLQDELVETLEEAGLNPITAWDVAEHIINDSSIQKRLRMLTGEMLISGGIGLQDSD